MLLSQAGGSSLMMIVMYIVVFGAIMYFMLVRPQKKQEKEMAALHSSMRPGDSVLTTSGFYGVILDVMDDTVIVEFGSNKNCRIPMQKSAIAAVEKPSLEKTEEEE